MTKKRQVREHAIKERDREIDEERKAERVLSTQC
jgi:hypothetical protein